MSIHSAKTKCDFYSFGPSPLLKDVGLNPLHAPLYDTDFQATTLCLREATIHLYFENLTFQMHMITDGQQHFCTALQSAQKVATVSYDV